MFKWILAVMGYMFFRYPGAILGFIVGTVIDNWNRSSGGIKIFFSEEGQSVSPGDFELNLLSLASLVIKADGQVSKSELDFVRAYFIQAYGKERANATFRTFNEVIKDREISAQRIGLYLQKRTKYEVRLQILHFLFSIAQADGSISTAEVSQLQSIAGFLGLNTRDFESIKAMFLKSVDNAYKILEIEKEATDAEVKKAYRTMAKKYHPDKLQHMDPAYQKGAQDKFTKVQEAYEQIQKKEAYKAYYTC